jgi:hypothetical protein
VWAEDLNKNKKGNGNFWQYEGEKRRQYLQNLLNTGLSNLAFMSINTYVFDDRIPYPKRTTLISSRSLAIDDMKVLPERKNQ